MVVSLARPAEFTAIFDRHARSVLGFLERRVGPGLAEDLLSDVFRIAFERRSDFDIARAEAAPWLFGIAGNLVRRHRRSQERRFRAIARAAADHAAVVDDATDGVTEAVDARRQLPMVVEAMNELSDIDRDVLLMAAFEQMPQATIAAALSIPVGTVKSRLSRARRVVRERLVASGQVQGEEGSEGR